MDIKTILNELDFALDSIFPIEERITRQVAKQKYITEIMPPISGLRGHLLTLRDQIVVENGICGRKELYHPLEALPLDAMKMLYDDMPDNLADKYFDQTAYNRINKVFITKVKYDR